jgi:hypothetical protein
VRVLRKYKIDGINLSRELQNSVQHGVAVAVVEPPSLPDL